MKHYVLNPTGHNTPRYMAWYDYIIDLDNQVWSLYDYLTFINPNYLIFNETNINMTDSGIYYSNADLEQLHLIQPVYFEINKNEYEKGIIVFPGHLPFHRGIVNNFSEYNKNYTLLCWFSYDDVFNNNGGWSDFGVSYTTVSITNKETVLVPANSWVINYQKFMETGQLITGFGLTDINDNVHKIDFAETRLQLRLVDANAVPIINQDQSVTYKDSDVVFIGKGQLRLASNANSILLDPLPVTIDQVAKIMVFPEAYTVLSLIAPSKGRDYGSNPDKQNPANFFLGSLSASAAIYRLTSSISTSTTYYSKWKYSPPNDSTGSDLLFNFTAPRSYLRANLTNWNQLTNNSASFQQMSTNIISSNRMIYIGNILPIVQEGVSTDVSQVWTQFDPLDSEFVMMSAGTGSNVMIEPIEVIQTVEKTSTTNLAGEGVAWYTINIKNYNLSLFNNVKWFLW